MTDFRKNIMARMNKHSIEGMANCEDCYQKFPWKELKNVGGKFVCQHCYQSLTEEKFNNTLKKIYRELGNLEDSKLTLPIEQRNNPFWDKLIRNFRPEQELIYAKTDFKAKIAARIKMANRQFDNWIDTFISEKGIDLEETFEVEGPVYGTNTIPYGVIIEHMKIAGPAEQAKLKDMIVKLDFKNADIKAYLRHLGQAIAR